MLGDDVKVTVVGIRDDKVMLGITAPKTIPVHRREIYDAIQREREAVRSQGQTRSADDTEPEVARNSESMLVVSRHRDESIMLGDDVKVTVVGIRDDKVMLGITAPKTIPVHRAEIYDAIQREREEAGKARVETIDGKPEEAVAGVPEESIGVSQLAQELAVPVSTIMEQCIAAGLAISSPASPVPPGVAGKIRSAFTEPSSLEFAVIVPDTVSEDNIESVVLRLVEEADEVHRERGGNGVKVVILEVFEDVSVGTPVER